MIQPLRLVIADDYPLFLEGLHLLLGQEEEVRIVGEAANGEQLLQRVAGCRPDVVITDIQMPQMDGITATKALRERAPDVKVIALTMFNEEQLIVDMLEAGASGYLLKSTSKTELLKAVRSVYDGYNYFCNQTSLRLSKLIAESRSPLLYPTVPLFSEKEIEIIRLICDQHASKQIADLTSLTHRTVEKYRDRIMDKTGSKNVAGIVIYAIKNGFYRI
ncbi:MAG: two component transcriptional regulator, LuxR family [Flaviaesturariibacter sp.]|nr:two component transcriptional regulator, LuxR family [Flaviaesturariibacter sp.]